MKKTLALLALAAAGAVTSLPAAAQFAKAEDAIKYRQSSFFVLGQHFSRIGAMANGKAPFDAKVAQENAELVAMLAKLPGAGFGPGTDKGAPTKAKPEIWTEQAKFKEHAEKFLTETTKLAAASKTGDLAQLKAAFGPAAQTCKACHDAFKDK
ncbi:MAG: cytochrome c [Giesbergeria sp.]|uniref:c-type cytochrome n=1 Tax=Giesbergeria sp. TaxID=2818473 RepID=UPI0026182B1B|nr:cytochrome c [Giesbergeria sp.]MDD2609933.1 cytochrome c [Giesbergeria sp.]